MQILNELYRVGDSSGYLSDPYKTEEEGQKAFADRVHFLDGFKPVSFLGIRISEPGPVRVVLQRYYTKQTSWFDEAWAERVLPGGWIADEPGTEILNNHS